MIDKHKEKMGCNSSKATNVTESNIENDVQAAADTQPVDQGPVFYTWGFSPFCRAVAMVAAELEIDLTHKVCKLIKAAY